MTCKHNNPQPGSKENIYVKKKKKEIFEKKKIFFYCLKKNKFINFN